MTPLRIGFSGNQNNSPFMLARALRTAGHDVRFLVDRPEPAAHGIPQPVS